MPVPDRALDGSRTTEIRSEIVELYRLCYAAPPWSETPEQLDGYPLKLDASLTRPGFSAWTSRDASGMLTGICYGWPSPPELPDHHIYTALQRSFPAQEVTAITRGAFEVAELFIHPAARNKGIGARLLVQATSCWPSAWLITSPTAPAAALYRRLGWREAGMLLHNVYPQLDLAVYTQTT